MKPWLKQMIKDFRNNVFEPSVYVSIETGRIHVFIDVNDLKEVKNK